MLGMVVTDKLIQAFPDIMDVKFTAGMEGRLDEIEDEHKDWVKLLREFYGPFHQNVEGAIGKLEHAGGQPSPYKCPKCGKPMLYRISKGEFFLACSDSECKTFQSVDRQGMPKMREVSEFKCPKCGRDMIKRKGRFGEFLGCSGYSVKNEKGEPSCDVIINLDKEGKPQPPKVKLDDDRQVREVRLEHGAARQQARPVPRLLQLPQVPQHEDGQEADRRRPAAGRGAAAAAEGRRRQGPRDGRQDHRRNPRRRRPRAALRRIATDIDCDDCGKPMVMRKGRRGWFLGCSGYPKCKNTGEPPAKLVEELGLNGDGAGRRPVPTGTPRPGRTPRRLRSRRRTRRLRRICRSSRRLGAGTAPDRARPHPARLSFRGCSQNAVLCFVRP